MARALDAGSGDAFTCRTVSLGPSPSSDHDGTASRMLADGSVFPRAACCSLGSEVPRTVRLIMRVRRVLDARADARARFGNVRREERARLRE